MALQTAVHELRHDAGQKDTLAINCAHNVAWKITNAFGKMCEFHCRTPSSYC